MAWFSDLAGRAEDLLNNIDRNTAAVLKKDNNHRNIDDAQLLEVMTLPSSKQSSIDAFIQHETSHAFANKSFHAEKKSPFHKLSTSIPNTPVRNKSSLNVQSDSSIWIDSNLSNLKKSAELIEVNEEKIPIIPTNVTDNKLVADLEVLNDDKSIVDIDKPPEHDVSEIPQVEVEVVEKKVYKTINNEEKVKEYQKRIDVLQEKLNSITSEKSRFLREINDLTSTLDKTRTDLKSLESELEQHRARAIKTLQEKDKMIAELRNNPASEFEDNSVLVELDQLRQERDVLREDNRQIREKLRLARQEAIDADLNAEKIRQSAMEGSIQARETIAAEKRKRLDVEEEARLRSEEARSLREELNLRHTSFSTKLQKQEAEITRLRSQLSTVSIPNAEVENRLSNLTRTLVVKQQELENLTLERNALRLQIEKLETERQNWRKEVPFNNINDTDDVKALLPSFLMESPFDSGVSRRVKRAYSTLDAIGIRIGVFLRRYPLARILVLIYMALLQFWVLFVLLSQSPEAH